jgi:hypothetical protein
MKLSAYFENAKGTGVLTTTDADGKVNVAIYARPHFLDANDDETIAFIMADRLSHANVQANPHAAYLFMEEGKGYAGKRLTLRRAREEADPEKIQSVRRRQLPSECEESTTQFLVYFRVDSVRPLIGTD